MIQCSECKHWGRTWIGGMATVVEGEWNTCVLMNGSGGKQDHPKTLAYAKDDCWHLAEVKTAPTFSCSMFESNAHFAKLRIDVQEGA